MELNVLYPPWYETQFPSPGASDRLAKRTPVVPYPSYISILHSVLFKLLRLHT